MVDSGEQEQEHAEVVQDQIETTEQPEQEVPVKQPCGLVFIGQDDSTKSAICGNIMKEACGIVDADYMKQAEREGFNHWWYAYANRIHEDAEAFRANFDTPNKSVRMFDAPCKQKDYSQTLIERVSLADICGLVVSGADQELERGLMSTGKTQEYIQLAKALGIKQLIIVVTKMEEGGMRRWSQRRWEEIKIKLEPFLLQAGFTSSEYRWVPVTSLGTNIAQRIDPEVCSWYKGPSLLELVDSLPVAERDPEGSLRVPILAKRKEEDVCFLDGKVEAGTLVVGEQCVSAPNGQHCTVEELFNTAGQNVQVAGPGEYVTMKMSKIEPNDNVVRGDVICPRPDPAPCVKVIEATIELLDLMTYQPLLMQGFPCLIHIHSFQSPCVVRQKSAAMGSFSTALVNITVDQVVPCEKFTTDAQMGRFTLRARGKSIALGFIEKAPKKTDWQTHTVKMMSILWNQKVNYTPPKILSNRCPFNGLLADGQGAYRSYINAFMQCMVATPGFYEAVTNPVTNRRLNKSHSKSFGAIASTLCEFLMSYRHAAQLKSKLTTEVTEAKLEDVIKVFGKREPEMGHGKKGDPLQFGQLLLQYLKEDTMIPSNNMYTQDITKAKSWQEMDAMLRRQDNSMISDLFRFITEERLGKGELIQCKFNPAMLIQIQPKVVEGKIVTGSVEEAVQSFLAPTQIKAVDGSTIDKCVSFCTLPDVLVINVKRFIALPKEADGTVKRKKLNFPIQLSKQLAIPSKSSKEYFELIAVLDHHGDQFHGHCTAQVHDHQEKQKETWYNCNDSKITQLEGPATESKTAYILLYRKIKEFRRAAIWQTDDADIENELFSAQDCTQFAHWRHGPFDFKDQAKQVQHKFKATQECLLATGDAKIQPHFDCKNLDHLLQQEQTPLIKIVNEKDCFYVSSQCHADNEEQEESKEEESEERIAQHHEPMYMVVRTLKKNNERIPYKLKERDVIKLGRLSYIVRQIKTKIDIDQAVKGREDTGDVANSVLSSGEHDHFFEETAEVKVLNNMEEVSEYESEIVAAKKIKCPFDQEVIPSPANPLIQFSQHRGDSHFMSLSALKNWIESKKQIMLDSHVQTYTWSPFYECEVSKRDLPSRFVAQGQEYELLHYGTPTQAEAYLILETLEQPGSEKKVTERKAFILTPDGEKREFKMGKDATSDIVMDDATSAPFHAKIRFDKGDFYLEDAEPMSKYGTMVLVKEKTPLMPGFSKAVMCGQTVTFFSLEPNLHSKAFNDEGIASVIIERHGEADDFFALMTQGKDLLEACESVESVEEAAKMFEKALPMASNCKENALVYKYLMNSHRTVGEFSEDKQQKIQAFEQCLLHYDRCLHYGVGKMPEAWTTQMSKNGPTMVADLLKLLREEPPKVKVDHLVRIYKKLDKATHMIMELAWTITRAYFDHVVDEYNEGCEDKMSLKEAMDLNKKGMEYLEVCRSMKKGALALFKGTGFSDFKEDIHRQKALLEEIHVARGGTVDSDSEEETNIEVPKGLGGMSSMMNAIKSKMRKSVVPKAQQLEMLVDKTQFISEGMLNFQPDKDRDVFFTVETQVQRQIFQKCLYLSLDEVTKLEDFRAFCDRSQRKCPPGYDDVTFEILRFLQTTQTVSNSEVPYTHARALEIMEKHYDWRQETFPMPQEKYAPFLESGFFYVHKRDKQYRPVMVLNLQRVGQLAKKATSENMMNLVYATMDFAAERLMIGGKIEQWSIIVDMKDASLTDKITFQIILLVMKACLDYFPGRLYRMFIVNGGWTVSTMLPAALYFALDKMTTKRIAVCKEIPSLQLIEHIGAPNLEEKYGGDRPNVAGGRFFPPDMSLDQEKLLPSSFQKRMRRTSLH